MQEKLITGSAVCRRRKSQTQWLLVRATKNGGWEFPKDSVRRGESSVSAIIRYLNEAVGLRARIIEEAGRATVSSTSKGETQEEKLVFYLACLAGGQVQNGHIKRKDMKWFSSALAAKNLSLARERRILKQANNVFKEWQKEQGD